MWIGIDDTDSPRGGCTTWALTELIAESRRAGVDLIGEPRLVRLNPNVPWKTRGNAALAARFGRGRGRRRRLGEIEGEPILSFPEGRELPPDESRGWLDRAWQRLLSASRAGEPGTDPAMVAVRAPLPARLYWDAVRKLVDVTEVRRLLERSRAFVRTCGSERGIVGAAAAVAWRGAHPTWELIAYRAPERWGRPRQVDAESVRTAAARFPGLFLCEDPRTRRLLVAPHTPCPILYGLRGTDARSPLAARPLVRSEPVDRWVIFRTNQGTGDHLRPLRARELAPFEAGILTGTVDSSPEVVEGGHVRLSLRDEAGDSVPCLAFEPTKTLPRVAGALVAGDRVRLWGSRGEDPAFRLEGIEIVRLVPRVGRLEAPRCPACDRPSHSLGRSRGYRCRECRRRWPPEAAVRSATRPAFGPGVYHPTPSARRHLAPRGPER